MKISIRAKLSFFKKSINNKLNLAILDYTKTILDFLPTCSYM